MLGACLAETYKNLITRDEFKWQPNEKGFYEKRLVFVLVVLVVVIVSLALVSFRFSLFQRISFIGSSLPALHVKGNKILDENGN